MKGRISCSPRQASLWHVAVVVRSRVLGDENQWSVRGVVGVLLNIEIVCLLTA